MVIEVDAIEIFAKCVAVVFEVVDGVKNVD